MAHFFFTTFAGPKHIHVTVRKPMTPVIFLQIWKQEILIPNTKIFNEAIIFLNLDSSLVNSKNFFSTVNYHQQLCCCN